MSFSSPNTTNTGSATGDKFSKGDQHPSPNFGQRLLQYGESRNPLLGGLMEQVFGKPQAPIDHNSYGLDNTQFRPQMQAPELSSMPDGSQGLAQPQLDMQKAHGINVSAIAKLLMGA